MVKILQLYDTNHNKICGLTNYKELKIEREINNDTTLSFLYPNVDKNYNLISEETYIRTKENEYVVKVINVGEDWTEYICKINLETIKGNFVPHFETVRQKCEDAINLAIAGTGWAIGSCDVTKLRTVRKNNVSSYVLLQEIQNAYGCEMTFDSVNKKVYIYKSMGTDKGTYFSEQLNLKKLDIQRNSYDYITRLIPKGKDGLGISSINNGKEYIENYQYSNKVITAFWEDNRYTVAQDLLEDGTARLNYLSKPYKSYSADIIDLAKISGTYKNILDYGLGDTITLMSKSTSTKEKQRIIKITEFPEEPEKNSCEIANKLLSLEDLQVKFVETADVVDSVTTSTGEIDGTKVDGINWDKIQHIHVKEADVENLSANITRIGTLETTTATITQLNASNAKIDDLYAKKATITDLTATNAKINTLETNAETVNNLLAGNIGANNLQAGAITAGSTIIAKGAIGDAQISSLSATKLSAGVIDATLITVKNLNADNITVGSINGQRIENGAIDNSKVAEGANISGSKLNINDVIVTINGATTQINSTKIQVGDRTLDAELSTQKIKVDENTTQIGKQATTITAMDDALNFKVESQTFNNYKTATDGSISNISTNLDKANASIGILKDDIDLRVKTTDLETKVLSTDLKTITSTTPITSLADSVDGVLNVEVQGNTRYKLSDGSYTDDLNSGRNLAIKTNTNLWSSWGSGTINNTQNNGVYSFKATNIGTINNQQFGIQQDSTGSLSFSLLANKVYTLSFDIRGDIRSLSYVYLMKKGNANQVLGEFLSGIVLSTTNYVRVSRTFTHDSTVSPNGEFIMISAMQPMGTWFEVKNIKLEQGTTATDYTPAPEDGVTLESVGELEGNKIEVLSKKYDDSIGDKINILSTLRGLQNGVRDIASGDIIDRKVGKIVFNGSENWIYNGEDVNTMDYLIFYIATPLTMAKGTSIISSFGIGTNNVSAIYKKADGCSNSSNVFYVSISKSKLSTPDLAGFKAWLSENNTTVYYELATPTTEKLPQPLTLQCFKGGSLSIGSVISPSVIVKYPVSLNGALNGTVTRVTDVNTRLEDTNAGIEIMKNGIDLRVKTSDFNSTVSNINGEIDGTKSRLSTTENSISILQSGINLKASKTDLETTNSNVSGVTSRLSTAEASISVQAGQIANKVSVDGVKSVIEQNPNSVQTAFNGATGKFIIKNGNLEIQATSGRTALSIDTDGYIMNEWGIRTFCPSSGISMDGALLSDGDDHTLLRAYGILYGSSAGRPLNFISRNGVKITYGDGVSLGELTSGMVKSNSLRTSIGSATGIDIKENDVSSYTGRLWLNYSGKKEGIETETLVGNGRSTGGFGILHCGDFYSHGSKNALVKTGHYGERAVSAYETAETYFGDIGRGKVIDGICVVNLEKIFLETVNSDIQYEVFLSKYGKGDIWVDETNKESFIVKGDDISFAWEVKAKRKGYEDKRLELIQ